MLGVVLAGGKGTRLLPQSEIHNKHLMPIYSDQGAIPMIWYPIHTLIKSGITKILIISSQEHCGDIIEFLGDGDRFGANFSYKIQDHNDPIHKPVGIASALKLSKDFTRDKKFAVILGDNFFENTFEAEVNSFKTSNLLGRLFLKDVGNDITRFGCATIQNNKVTKIVEKPSIPESSFAVTGLYFYTPDVYTVADTCKVSSRGELEISHINDCYALSNTLDYSIMNGFWSDMGVPSSICRTIEWINSNNFKIFG